MFRFLILLGEAGAIRFGRWSWAGRISRRIRAEIKYWYWGVRFFIQDVRQALSDALRGFGRPPKASHTFTWWTYYVAVTRSLRHARMAKYSWGTILDAETVCLFYDRYAGVQKRAREQGYVKLAREDIHDKWVLKVLVDV